MPTGKLPKGVKAQKGKNGQLYHYHRETGARFLSRPGTVQFKRELDRIESRLDDKLGTGPLMSQLLMEYRRSPRFLGLKPRTKGYYDKMLYIWREELGEVPIAQVRFKHIIEVAEGRFAKSKAGYISWLVVSSILMDYATVREYRDGNPIPRRFKKPKHGHYAHWEEPEVDFFITNCQHERSRLAVALGFYTGQRISDLCAMKWEQYDGQFIHFTQEASTQKTGEELVCPVHPKLKVLLDDWQGRSQSEVVLDFEGINKAPSANTVSNVVRKYKDALGMRKKLPFHGLRKTASISLAHSGANTHEIMARTGHRSPQMISLYTKGVNQRKLAESGMRKQLAREAAEEGTVTPMRHKPVRV
jgi:integrase